MSKKHQHLYKLVEIPGRPGCYKARCSCGAYISSKSKAKAS